MFKIAVTAEVLESFVRRGNKVFQGKCIQGLPAGSKLERVEMEPLDRVVFAYFSHPDSPADGHVQSISINYETKRMTAQRSSLARKRW